LDCLLVCGDRRLDLRQPVVMGILNVTPDSFSDGGRYPSVLAAIEAGLAMQAGGAAIVDVGGESTRPGAQPIPVDEEIARVLPVVEGLARREVLVSVDTSSPEVMRLAADAGAAMINDVRGFRRPGALATLAATGLAACVMHAQGEPQTMQNDPSYSDVVTEVKAFLAERLQACRAAGIAAERLVVDPGFGFGKTAAHNLALLRGLPQIAQLGAPVLAGLSRKSLVGLLTGRAVGERLAGSLALAMLAIQAGARIVRAHDVRETVDVLRVLRQVEQGS
jgi:dihydropteroate synthase